MSSGKTDGRGIDCKAASLAESVAPGRHVSSRWTAGRAWWRRTGRRGPSRGSRADRLGDAALSWRCGSPSEGGSERSPFWGEGPRGTPRSTDVRGLTRGLFRPLPPRPSGRGRGGDDAEARGGTAVGDGHDLRQDRERDLGG